MATSVGRSETWVMWMKIEPVVKRICWKFGSDQSKELIAEIQLLFVERNAGAGGRTIGECVNYCELLLKEALRTFHTRTEIISLKQMKDEVRHKLVAEFVDPADPLGFSDNDDIADWEPAAEFVDPTNPMQLDEKSLEFLESPAVSEEAKEMFKMIIVGETQVSVAKRYGISPQAVKRRLEKQAEKLNPSFVKTRRAYIKKAD